jgi:hypothetical protein
VVFFLMCFEFVLCFKCFFSKLRVKSHFVSIGDFEKCNSNSSQCKSRRFFLCVCFFIFRVGSSKGSFSHLYREKRKGD